MPVLLGCLCSLPLHSVLKRSGAERLQRNLPHRLRGLRSLRQAGKHYFVIVYKAAFLAAYPCWRAFGARALNLPLS